jgi:hypothetical protein
MPSPNQNSLLILLDNQTSSISELKGVHVVYLRKSRYILSATDKYQNL